MNEGKRGSEDEWVWRSVCLEMGCDGLHHVAGRAAFSCVKRTVVIFGVSAFITPKLAIQSLYFNVVTVEGKCLSPNWHIYSYLP